MKKTGLFVTLLVLLVAVTGGCGGSLSRSNRMDSESCKDSVDISKTMDSVLIYTIVDDTLPELSLHSEMLPSYYRYKFDSITDVGANAHYELAVDFPKSSVRNASTIRRWLFTEITGTSLTEDTSLVNICDDNGVAQYASIQYFDDKRDEYGDFNIDDEDYKLSVFLCVELQAKVCTDRFVSYLKFMHDYNGGTHGYYTEKLVSYDHVHQQEIDNDYLFKPECMDEVLTILLEEAQKTSQYKKWNPDIMEYVSNKDEKGNKTGGFTLPCAGLTKDSIVFSFQPYAISCFAAGVFHFPVPYNRIKHCMTEKALWCVGLTN